MKIFKKMKKGFTLVELVVVIAVIAILAGVSVGAYFGITDSANASKLEQEAKQVHTAIQTVALAPNEHSSLTSNGLTITDTNLFEDKLIETLGHDVYLTNVEKETVDSMPTIYFSSAEYSARVENGFYKSFEYYIPGITNKKASVDVVTGECSVVAAGETSVVDPDAGKVWYLVKDASELKATDRIVIAAKDYNYALSTEQKTNNRGFAAIERNENLITFGEDTQVITLEKGAIEGTFAFNVGEGYLYAAGNTSNYLKTNGEVDNNGFWTISIYATSATITANGDNSRNTLKFNNSNSPKLFSCYASDSTTADAVAIYKLGFYEEKECEHNFGDNLEFCSICGERNENYQAPTEPEVLDKSIPELKVINVSDTSAYYVDGYITGWYGTAGFGNFYIAENLSSNADSSILVYGASEIADRLAFDGEKYSYESKQDFNYTDYKIGDYVKMKVIVKIHNEVNQLSGVIVEKTHINTLLTLNITCGEDTRVADLTNQEVSEVFENISVNDTFTAVVKDSENTVYTFDTFTADKAGKWSITYNFYNKTITTNLLEGVSEDGITSKTIVIKDYATANSWENQKRYLTINGDNFSITTTSTSNSGKYYENGFDWRIYQTEKSVVTISANEGYTLVKVAIFYNGYNTGCLISNENQINTGDEIEVNNTSIAFSVGNTTTATNGQARITSIAVSYKVSETTEEPTPDTEHTEHTFDTTGSCTFEGCDAKCKHEDGWDDQSSESSTCATCGYTCTHTVAPGNTCQTCGYQEPAVEEPQTKQVFKKVTSNLNDYTGIYLIVYESGNKAFNGDLDNLDGTSNFISVSITNKEIEYNETTAKAIFEVASISGGWTLKSYSGCYIGQTANSNGLKSSKTETYVNTISIASGTATIGTSAGPTLKFNNAADQLRFRYYKSDQQSLALYKLETITLS